MAFHLRVELERESAEYRPGEDVSGLLVVTVDGPTACKGLTVETGYRAHGAGDEANGIDGRVELGARAFEPGTHRIPFAIAAPDGPLSYSGKLVRLDWELRARADVDWAVDRSAVHDFRLLPWTRETATTGPVYRGTQRAVREAYEVAPEGAGHARNDRAMSPSCATAYGGCLLIAALVVLIFWHAAAAWMLAGALGVSAVACLAWGVPKVMARNAMGNVTLEIAPESLHAGETLEASMQFTPRRTLERLAVRLELSCSEVALKTSSVGSDSATTETLREALVTEQTTLLSDSEAAAGKPIALHGGWKVPDAGPPTLCVDNNEVRWEVALDATWRGGHHRETRSFKVLPARIS